MGHGGISAVLDETVSHGAIMAGIDLLATMVGTSIGPAGRSVVAGRNHARPQLVRGGYTIARELDGVGASARTGIIMMREMAWRIQEEVGDGTSTGILLAHRLARGIGKAIAGGAPRNALLERVGLHAAAIADELRDGHRTKPGDAALLDIATRAAGGDETIGRLVADASRAIGPEGFLAIDPSKASEDKVEIAQGLHFDSTPLSAHLFDDPRRQRTELANPLILLHHGGIGSLSEIAPVLEMIARSGRSLLIVADEICPEAIATLVINKRRGGLRVAAAKSPGSGLWRLPMMEDIAIATGGGVLSPLLGTGLSSLSPRMMGQAGSAVVSQGRVTISGGLGAADSIRERCDSIRHQIDAERNLSLDRDLHRLRLARLVAGAARIHIGGRTETEQEWRERAATRAAAAIRSAIDGGVCGGGGSALIQAGETCDGTLSGDEVGRAVSTIFRGSLPAPAIAICDNAGLDGRAIARLAQGEIARAYDVRGRRFVPSASLAEPTSVQIAALLAATSTATAIASVGCCVTRGR